MIKYLIMDVDGSLTDGKIYMGPSGEEMKAFSVKDGYVFRYILKPLNIKPIIITARNSEIVNKRCEELGIEEVYQGKADKLSFLLDVIGEKKFGSCAYFGDDILDLDCMKPIKKAGGVIGCPSDAVQEIKLIADYICINKAGNGALREFVEWLIKPKEIYSDLNQKINYALNYLDQLKIKNMAFGNIVQVNEFFCYSIQSYSDHDRFGCELESHRKYIEIQMLLKGEEVIEIADVARLAVKKDYDEKKDVMYWIVPDKLAQFKLKSNDYVIFFPENAYRRIVKEKEKGEVIKIIGKILI